MRLIGLCGKKHSGKTTLALFASEYRGYKLLNFADELKDIVYKCLFLHPEKFNVYSYRDLELYKDKNIEIFLSNDQIYFLEKNINIKLDKYKYNSIREILQYIGTDIIRRHDPNWHIKKLNEKLNLYKKIVIADCRFFNEKSFIESLGGKCYYINRQIKNSENINFYDSTKHISETELSIQNFDKDDILINNKNIELFIKDNEKIF